VQAEMQVAVDFAAAERIDQALPLNGRGDS
jgi:hypothetical protein